MTKRFVIKDGKDRIKQIQDTRDYLNQLPETDWEVIIRKPTRTKPQNKAIHLFFAWVAEALNEAHLTFTKVFKPDMEMEWTSNMVKELLWRPAQKIMTGKTSSTKLTTKELTDVADAIQKALAVKGVSVDFPSMEGLLNNVQQYEIID